MRSRSYCRNPEEENFELSMVNVFDALYENNSIQHYIHDCVIGMLTSRGDRRVTYFSLCEGIAERDGEFVSVMIPVLLYYLFNDSNYLVRRKCALSLGYIGNSSAVLALANSCVNDEDSSVRGNSIVALGLIGPKAKLAIPSLINCFHSDENHMLRKACRRAIADITGEDIDMD